MPRILKSKLLNIKLLKKDNKDGCVWHTLKQGEEVPEKLLKYVEQFGGELYEEGEEVEAPKPEPMLKVVDDRPNLPEEEKSEVDKRVADYKEDLEDDGKANNSNDPKKKSPGRKKKGSD